MRVTELRDRFAYRSDLVELSGSEPVWIQVAAAGTWKHPRYGEVEITKEHLAAMFRNFKTGAHPLSPVELPVDYEHLSTQSVGDRKPGDGIAAGWYKDIQLRNNGLELWGLIDWTPAARKKIADREYRYFSPTFHPNYRNELGVTLTGGALTNYPTLPGCVVTCSLDSGADVPAVRLPVSSHEGHTMKIKGKNDKGEIVEVEIDESAITLDALANVPVVKELQAKIPTGDVVTMSKVEFDAVNTQMKTLSTMVNDQKTTIDSLSAAHKELKARELEIELDALHRAGKLLPAERETFKKLANTNRELFDEMVAARQASAPLVRLDTTSGSGGTGPSDNSAEALMLSAIDEKRKANPTLDTAGALKLVTSENPELAKRYLDSKRLPIGKGGVYMGNVQ